MVACNIVGNVMPQLLIFDTKKIQHAWIKNEVPGSKYGISDKDRLFENWFACRPQAGACLVLKIVSVRTSVCVCVCMRVCVCVSTPETINN